ncbi:PglL family O-oligosaccharyltransferase [Motilimonas eburnea]|uniref:PglL family O-oligosaccharyltransferase n=1 Tax=Motilimonas eburnea TaxID=1737488 RepID=UPI001E291C6E|nr:PglL family O-oligosaccharyltransferase [Motilimonas eburnea]
MHYFQHNQGGAGLDLPINPIAWAFTSILIAIGLWQITLSQRIVYNRLSLAGLIAFLLLLVPIFYPNAELAEASYPRILGFLGGILLLFALQQLAMNKAQWCRLLLFLVIAGFIEGIYSLVQMYIFKAGNPLGFNVDYGRPYGIFQQPNVLASFLATSLIIAAYLLMAWQPQGKAKWLFGFLTLHCFIAAWVIYICVSRTGYLGVTIGLALMAPWLWQRSKQRCMMLMAVIACGVSMHFIIADGAVSRDGAQLANAGARTLQYEQSWHMMQQKPLLGWGYGSFEVSFLHDRAERIANEGVPFVLENLTHPHNELMLWGVEGGILPILGLLTMAAVFISLLTKFDWRHALALLALVFPLTLHTQTEYPFYHAVATWVMFIVLAAFVSYLSNCKKEIQFRPTLLIRTNAILIVLITCTFMITAVHTNYLVTKFERTGRTNIDLLMQVVNPLALTTRLEFNIFTLRMLVGERLDKPEELKAYIDWATKFVEHTPRANIYYNLALANKLLGYQSQADETLAHARWLYPNNGLLRKELQTVVRDVEKTPSGIQETDNELAP